MKTNSAPGVASDASTSGEAPTGGRGGGASRKRRLPIGLTRNLGLVIALILLCVVGHLTADHPFSSDPDAVARFATTGNILTILRLSAVIGVVSIGQTFVITSGGIDLSVGSVLGLCSVWATTLSTQTMAEHYGWWAIVFTALAVGAGAGVINGLMVAYGRIVPFMATLAMMVASKGLAEMISDKKTQIVSNSAFLDIFTGNLIGVPTLVWIFAAVAIAAWFVFNRTTFGRRTVAIGGNLEASRLAGIKVNRNLVYLYALCGLCVGVAAVMLLARTTSGTATHGTLYEMDAIAAVVVGGTLLVGGRGTVTGTVLGVLIFTTLNNIFTLNNLSISAQAVAKGAIIVGAVLLQQRFASQGKRT